MPCFSVNLSRLDFRRGGDERLFDRVVDTLSRYDVPRGAIKLEITESLMLEDIDTFQKLFRQFRDAGFTLWIDDFGSGYSSLNVQQGFYYSRPLSGADFVAFIDAKRDLLGTEEDKAYWKQIGRLNFLSANPLDDYARMEQAERGEAPA
ncbi:MAG: EAL domain-containing protein, partial [Clostridia bacterium]|nr:EAL domain-containing protein [Clostridia bacterium]